jgi:hypothetical protein
VRRPEDRLGCGPLGAYELNTHPFFRGIDWDELLQVCINVIRGSLSV